MVIAVLDVPDKAIDSAAGCAGARHREVLNRQDGPTTTTPSRSRLTWSAMLIGSFSLHIGPSQEDSRRSQSALFQREQDKPALPGRPYSLRAVREQLFTAMRVACTPWRNDYAGRAPLNDDAENAFLRAVGAWETFLSGWTIGAVVRDPRTLQSRLVHELDEWVAKKYGMSHQELVQSGMIHALKATLSLSQPTYEDVRKLLDPRGRHIEFDSVREFAKYAHQNVAQTYAVRATAAVPQPASIADGVVEAATALRNWLTHGSPHSRDALRQSLAALHDPELQAAALPTSGGRYLKGFHQGAVVSLPEFTPSAQAPGTQAVVRHYERRTILLLGAEFARIAWILVPIEET